MAIFQKQLANVVEWEEFRDDMIFWKWSNRELKKGSRLIIRPGQDAIFLNNGRVEGIFKDDGDYDIESQIIPFLSTLKGIKFGFNSGMRAEILFINTKEFEVKWGTRNAINIPTPQLPGGLPIRANGSFYFKVKDYVTLIDNIAGVKQSYCVEDLRARIVSVLDSLLMKWIVKEGKDMFNLMANVTEISRGIKEDLDMEVMHDGISITRFNVGSFNYPEAVQDMINKNATQSMVGDMGRYQTLAMTDGIASGNIKGGGIASDMTGMMMGMTMANTMLQGMAPGMQAMNQTMNQMQPGQGMNQMQSGMNPNTGGAKPNFCPNCGNKTSEANFCPNCGFKLV